MKYYLLILTCLCLSCSKPIDEFDRPDSGYITMKLKPSASTEQGFALINSHQLHLKTLAMLYDCALPIDSSSYVASQIFSKPYFLNPNIPDVTVTTPYVGSSMRIEALVVFEDMNVANQNDWLTTIEQLRLTTSAEGINSWRVEVDKGNEKGWAMKLNQESLVDTAYVGF